MSERFQHKNYLIRKKVFKLFGGAFHIFDPYGELVMFAKMKAFKLKEDIRLYTREDLQEELLVIKARKVLDISATYDVMDSSKEEKVGALRRRGLKSIFKDEWLILDNNDNEIGTIKEDSALLAAIRRLLTNLVPQKYHAEMSGNPVCLYKQNFNPFVLKLNVDFSEDVREQFDRRLGLAAGVLLCAIEGRQS